MRTMVDTLTATITMTTKVVRARESVSTTFSRRAKLPTLLQWHWEWVELEKTVWQCLADQADLSRSQRTQVGELRLSSLLCLNIMLTGWV